MSIENKLIELGIKLIPVKTVGKYSPVIFLKQQNMIFLSGQLPFLNETDLMTGKVDDNNTEQGISAAKQCIVSGLSQIKHYIGLNMIKSVIQITGYVNSGMDFYYPHKVMDGASELIQSVLPENPPPARVSICVNSLPMNAMVEISMILLHL